MSKALITEDYLTNIADAIRAKNGSSDTYTPAQMAGAIENIPQGTDVEALSVNSNGTYTAPAGKAYSPVMVNVPGVADIEPLSVTANGTYTAESGKAYNPVTVNVTPSLISWRYITNGTKTPPAGYDGFSSVTIDVPAAKTVDMKLGEASPIISALADSVIGPMTSYNRDYIVPIVNDAEAKLDLSRRFSIQCGFKVGTAPGSSRRNVWGSRNSYYHCPSIAVYDNKITYFISTNGSTWAYNDVSLTPSGYSLPLNSHIEAYMQWNGQDMYILVQDGYNSYSAIIEGVTPYYNPNYTFEFGGQNKSSYSIASCSADIYLYDTFLMQEDTVIWGSNA